MKIVYVSFILTLLFLGCLGQTPAPTPTVTQPTVTQPKAPTPTETRHYKVLFIISYSDFRDEEYSVPKKFLEEKGVMVVVGSNKEGVATGVFGLKVKIDVAIQNVLVDEYDGIVFVGGPGTPQNLWGNSHAIRRAKEAYEKGKVLAAICLAPGVLAEAGVLKNKKATIFHTAKNKLIDAGAIYVDRPVVREGKIITARGPDAVNQFSQAIFEALSE